MEGPSCERTRTAQILRHLKMSQDVRSLVNSLSPPGVPSQTSLAEETVLAKGSILTLQAFGVVGG